MKPLFSDFERKSHSFQAHFMLKKRSFSKKHDALMPIFCQKYVHFLKIMVLSCHCFNYFIKNPKMSWLYWVQKNVKSLNTTQYYGPKKSIRCPFFSDYSRKNHYSHAHGLSKKRPLFKKHTVLMLIIWQKNVNYLKDKMLSCHVFCFNFPKIMEKTVVLEV